MFARSASRAIQIANALLRAANVAGGGVQVADTDGAAGASGRVDAGAMEQPVVQQDLRDQPHGDEAHEREHRAGQDVARRHPPVQQFPR